VESTSAVECSEVKLKTEDGVQAPCDCILS